MTKLCINCKHFQDGNFGPWCKHPNVGISPVTGKIKPALAWVIRSDWSNKESCGENGNWFETKYPVNPDKNNWAYMTVQRPSPEPVKLTLWQKLKGFFK